MVIRWILKLFKKPKRKTTPLARVGGAIKQPVDERDYLIKLTGATLPAQADLTNYCGKIKQQGGMNSCTAHAVVSCFEIETRLAGKEVVEGSELYNYYQSRSYAQIFPDDEGAYLRDAVKMMRNYGNCPEKLMPYDDAARSQKPGIFCDSFAKMFKITSYEKIWSVPGIKQSLAELHPVMLAIPIYQSIFSTDDTIKVPTKNDYQVGAHAIVVVGYDDTTQNFRILNSWGIDWGEVGFANLPYDYLYAADWFDAWRMKIPQ